MLRLITTYLIVSSGELSGLIISKHDLYVGELSSTLSLGKNLHYGKYFNFLTAFATVLLVTSIHC